MLVLEINNKFKKLKIIFSYQFLFFLQNYYIYTMNLDFYEEIALSTAHRKCRDTIKNFVFANPEYLGDLVAIALLTTDKNHHKACWILELICEEQLEIFSPFLSKFCSNLERFTSDSAIRSVSKISLFLAKSKKITLTETQENALIAANFNWLLTTNKAANAAYSMRALYLLGKKQNWIHDELKTFLSKDFDNQTPGYCFAVKDMLARLK